jgi:LPS-assembly protein
MLRSILTKVVLLGILWAGAAATAAAQDQQVDIAGCKDLRVINLKGFRFPVKNEKGEEEMRAIMTGTRDEPVEVDCDNMQLFAEQMEVFSGHQVVATGSVLFVQGGNRISATRLEFDTKTKTGVFFNAQGEASIAGRVDRSLFGTQEPDAYFNGEEIHKLGPQTYKIVRGAFTTCVQPTPRWQMVAGSVTVTLDDHALMTNAILKVKGVPVMYMPIFYYPVQEDDRATGFLMPIYGTSTLKGQSLTNQFFWAIDRSQDATLSHDWYSKTGQGFGGEYRYERGAGNHGQSTVYVLNEHAASYEKADGTTAATAASKSYQIVGGLSQALGAGLHARADVNYYSSIAVQQKYQQNFSLASTRTRTITGNVSGNWQEYVLSATVNRNDLFYGENSLTSTGGLPRITFNRGERPIGKSKLYFGVNTEFVTHLWRTESDGVTTQDRGLTRMDVNPVLRIPFTKLRFLTVNSSVSWRATRWSESLDASNIQVPVGIGRQYFDFQSRITGPVFNRIWNTPDNGYAQKFKHVIEPTLVIQRVTPIDVFDEIVAIDSADRIVGNVTRFTYGVNNRLYAKKDVSREIVSLSLNQSYYTDALASQYDAQYQSSFNSSTKPTKFSAVRMQARVMPTDRIQADFSTEWNPTAHTLTTFTANGGVNMERFQVSAGWTERRFIPDLLGYNNEALANHDINATATIRNPGNHLGGTYTFNYDLRNKNFRQQRYLAYYNAQCCGIMVEYQTYNFGGSTSLILPQDRRFNLSFTLAGIGTFSNFFGAFGQAR